MASHPNFWAALGIQSSIPGIATLLLGASFIYTCVLITYRLYFSPLSKFPGSKLAAATGWYETFFQLVKGGGGQFTFQIGKWHEKYGILEPTSQIPFGLMHPQKGPIVRITPHEIHIYDPDFYEAIYSQSQGIDKPLYAKQQFAVPGAIFSTIEHEIHRQRKAALLPYFSKRKILEQVPNIQHKVDKFCDRLANEYARTNKVLNLCDLFSCFTADIITKYAFDRSYNYLGAPDFISPFTTSINSFKKFGHYAIQFPWLPKLLARLPDILLMILQPSMVAAFQFKEVYANDSFPTHLLTGLQTIRTQVQDIQQSKAAGKDDRLHGTIFSELLNSNLPPRELTTERLMDEASGVVGAGIETTKWAMVVTVFHIINNPLILQRLRKDLEEAIPDPAQSPRLITLEQVPYLMACIEEG